MENKKSNFVLNGLEYNAVQVALDHLSEHLKESLDDSQLSDDERSDIEEKMSATIVAKSKFDRNKACRFIKKAIDGRKAKESK